jgi:hypothetical protein
LRYDSSIGWPSQPGLRAGTPYPYRLWDAERREPGGWELPLAVMDATLSEERYLGLDADAAYEAAVEALEPVAEHGGAVAILWHPPQHHPRLANGFDRVYRRLLAWIDERGGWAGSAGRDARPLGGSSGLVEEGRRKLRDLLFDRLRYGALLRRGEAQRVADLRHGRLRKSGGRAA